MARDFERAIDEKVDGVALIAYGFDADAHSLIHQAFARGTIVIPAAVELPDDEKRYSLQGMGYVGAALNESGVAAATEMAKHAELKASDSVLVWGEKAEGGEAGPHLAGLIDTLEKAGVKVIYLAIDPSAYSGDVDPSKEALSNVMAANPGMTDERHGR